MVQTYRLGIGLYAVKEIVAAHNGDVNVTSGAKEGTIFTMRLPHTTPHRRNSKLSEQIADIRKIDHWLTERCPE